MFCVFILIYVCYKPGSSASVKPPFIIKNLRDRRLIQNNKLDDGDNFKLLFPT